MLGHDIPVLLKIVTLSRKELPAKVLADELFIAPSEVSKSLRRSQDAGLLYWSDQEKRVNRPALLEFLAHGLRYVFPAEKGALVRGVPTASSAAPLVSHFARTSDPVLVWPYEKGTERGTSLKPLYKGAAKAALLDHALYELLALCDAIRGGQARERNLAFELLRKDMHQDAKSQRTHS